MARSTAARADAPLSATLTVMPRFANVSRRIKRFFALSSTTNTGIPLRSMSFGTGLGNIAGPNFAVKWNVLPRPTSLSTHILPPNIATSREEMLRPSPVPPNSRFMEPSA